MTEEKELALSRENLNSIISWLYEELRAANKTIEWYKKQNKMQAAHIRYKTDIFYGSMR